MPQSVISEHITITSETLAKQGISGQNKEKQNYDKNTFHLPRQYLPFHHGTIRFPGHDQPSELSGQISGRFQSDQYRRD